METYYDIIRKLCIGEYPEPIAGHCWACDAAIYLRKLERAPAPLTEQRIREEWEKWIEGIAGNSIEWNKYKTMNDMQKGIAFARNLEALRGEKQ